MFSGASGYNRKPSPSSSPSALTAMFASSAGNPVTSSVNMPQVTTQGPISLLAGTPGPEIPTTHQADIASGSNAGANLQASQNVNGKLGQVDEAKTQFAATAVGIQETLKAALEKGAGELGFDPQTARNSFMPPPPSNDAATVALNSGAPGVTAIADALNTLPKLNPKQEAALASKMFTLLTPTRDLQGLPTNEPAIPNKIAPQLEKLGSEIVYADFLKQALRPVEEQPEFKALSQAEETLKNAKADHARQNSVDEHVVAVAHETGADVAAVDAQKVDPDTVRFIGDTLADMKIGGDLRLSLAALSAANDPDFEEVCQRPTKYAVPPPRVALGMMAMGGVVLSTGGGLPAAA